MADFSAENQIAPETDRPNPAGETPVQSDADRIADLLAQNLAQALAESQSQQSQVTRRDDLETRETVEASSVAPGDWMETMEAEIVSLPEESAPQMYGGGTLLEYDQAAPPPARQRTWQELVQEWWRNRFASPAERAIKMGERVQELTAAIEQHPDAATNYVLRGELRLKIGLAEEAIADFERAESLADQEFSRSAWGIVAQSMRDRARRGLQQAQNKQARKIERRKHYGI